MEEISRHKYIPPDCNLRNWASIAYAASLWDKPAIGSLIEANSETELAARIKELVEKKEKEMHLPKAISDRVLCTFKSMGERIHVWCKYAQKTLKIPKDIAERVHWTTYGTIDEGKMLQDLISSKKFQEKRHLVPIEAIYSLACSSVSIEYIQMHWDEMLTFYGGNEKSIILDFPQTRELIIASVIFFANRNDFRIPVSCVETYSDAKNMLTLSVNGGYLTAARYYWCQLNENQKNELIVYIAQVVNSQYFNLRNCSRKPKGGNLPKIYKKQCFADLLIFFLNSMSEDDLRTLEDKEFRCRDTIGYILELLISQSPLEEYLPLAYDLTSKYCKSEENCHNLLKQILTNMDKNNTFGLWNKQNFAIKLQIRVG